jgi:hypothetical protein
MEKMLLTPTEAATTLGIGRSKLYELMRADASWRGAVGPHRCQPPDRVHGLARSGGRSAYCRRRSALRGSRDGDAEGRQAR